MKPIIIALFNNKGGVGKTTVVYHLAHIFPRIGYPTLAVDLDPQANLTEAFFDEESLTDRLENPGKGETIYSCIEPIMEGTGDIEEPKPLKVADGVFVLNGDLRLSLFEDKLSDAWPRNYEGDMSALRATTSFYRIMLKGAEKCGAKVVLVDVGPNLGAINRATILSVDYLILPLAVDLFSLQGLRNLGPKIRDWRKYWKTICGNNPNLAIPIPPGEINPIGYIVLQHAMRLDRPVLSYERWLKRIPEEYNSSVLGISSRDEIKALDPTNCLASLRHYRSLIPMSYEARKPVFDLQPADGAIGGHTKLVTTAYNEFKTLSENIIKKIKEKGVNYE
ncbi:MAG: ParA family protein [bacterium]|nr:ParA family protein [bacterium]